MGGLTIFINCSRGPWDRACNPGDNGGTAMYGVIKSVSGLKLILKVYQQI